MSELSQSLHLRGEGPQVVLNLLAAADVEGFVYPSKPGGRLIPFVCQPDALQRLIDHNRELLLLYNYDEEHGCSVMLYDGNRRVGRLEAAFDTERYGFDAQIFQQLGLVSTGDVGPLLQWVAHAHEPTQRSAQPRYIVAEALGLSRHAHFSFDHEIANEDPPPERLATARLSLSPRRAGLVVPPPIETPAPESYVPDDPPDTEPLYLDELQLDAPPQSSLPASAVARFTTLQPDPLSGPSSERASLELEAVSQRPALGAATAPTTGDGVPARRVARTPARAVASKPPAAKARPSKAPPSKAAAAKKKAKAPAKKAAGKPAKKSAAKPAKKSAAKTVARKPAGRATPAKKPAAKGAKASKPAAKKKPAAKRR
jgi:hypothetical protein